MTNAFGGVETVVLFLGPKPSRAYKQLASAMEKAQNTATKAAIVSIKQAPKAAAADPDDGGARVDSAFLAAAFNYSLLVGEATRASPNPGGDALLHVPHSQAASSVFGAVGGGRLVRRECTSHTDRRDSSYGLKTSINSVAHLISALPRANRGKSTRGALEDKGGNRRPALCFDQRL